MKMLVTISAIATLVVAMLLVATPLLAKGGSAKGADIWFYQGGDPGTVFKGIYSKTGSGIIHQWRYEPVDLHLLFKPASKFSKPDEGGYFYWQFTASIYTETDLNPGELADFFTDGAYYWVKIETQD